MRQGLNSNFIISIILEPEISLRAVSSDQLTMSFLFTNMDSRQAGG